MQDQAIHTTPKRLRILGDDEIEALYGRPHFSDDERLEYFALSLTEKAALEQLHSIKSRIYFILQLGYFKSHHTFFVFDLPDVAEDCALPARLAASPAKLAIWPQTDPNSTENGLLGVCPKTGQQGHRILSLVSEEPVISKKNLRCRKAWP
jgi:Domain of unknown function (DUF4158)